MKRIAIISTHPIQYNAPFFTLLSSEPEVDLKVFYTWGESSIEKFDPGFGKVIEWDIPLLKGYKYSFVRNTAKNPGSHHFKGIDNPGLVKDIEAFQPNAILVLGWAYKSHLKIIRSFSGKFKIWFRGDSNLIDYTPFIKRVLRKIFLTWLYSHVDLCFFVGSANKDYFLKFGLKEKQLKFSPHAIDIDRFSRNFQTESLQLRKSLHISSQSIVILFAGKLEQKKDPIRLLRAFETINNPYSYLIFAGNGALENQLLSNINSSICKERIRLIPFQNQSQMPILYQACDLFCLPSTGPGETWGLAVNEAMAAGRAILVSDKVGCAEDLVSNVRNGLVFKAGSTPDLIEKLSSILDKGKLKRMGIESGEIIKSWSFKSQVKAVKEELEKL